MNHEAWWCLKSPATSLLVWLRAFCKSVNFPHKMSVMCKAFLFMATSYGHVMPLIGAYHVQTNERGTSDVMWIFISRPVGFIHGAVKIGGHNYFVCNSWLFVFKYAFKFNKSWVYKKPSFLTNHKKALSKFGPMICSRKGRWAGRVADASLVVSCE